MVLLRHGWEQVAEAAMEREDAPSQCCSALGNLWTTSLVAGLSLLYTSPESWPWCNAEPSNTPQMVDETFLISEEGSEGSVYCSLAKGLSIGL